MINRIKQPGWPLWILVTAFALSVLLGFSFAMPSNKGNQAEEPIKTEAVVMGESGFYPGLHVKTVSEENDLYTSDIELITADNKAIQKPIAKWIAEQQASFQGSVKEYEDVLKKESKAHLKITVNPVATDGSLYSLVFTSYQYTGGANGMTVMKPFNIDPVEGKLLRLSDLFNLNEDGPELQEMVKSSILAQKNIEEDLFDDLLAMALNDPTLWKWSIGNDRLTVYFDEYEIAAGSAGVIKAELPIDEVSGLLIEEYANQF